MIEFDQEVRNFLMSKTYLVPAVSPRISNVCPRCRGPHPGSDHYTVCFQCGDVEGLFDELGFCIYAADSDSSNSGRVMYSYKGPTPSAEATQIVKSLLYEAFHTYLDQIPYPIDLITIVPSISTSRAGAHALVECVSQALSRANIDIPVTDALRPSGDATVGRNDILSSHFAWEGVDPTGKSVLLVEDTWVTGIHMRKAGWALRNAGFQNISGLCVARWMKFDHRNCEEIFSTAKREHLARDHSTYPLNPFTPDGSINRPLL